jgi:hypothetical protein
MENYLAFKIQEEFSPQEIPGGFHEMSSLGIGPEVAVPERPYIVYKELPSVEYVEVAEQSNVELRSFQIFVYDHRGDFSRINQYLRRIKQVVKQMAPFEYEGSRCSGVLWGGMSGYVVDDGYDSNTRYGIARFTVSDPVVAS